MVDRMISKLEYLPDEDLSRLIRFAIGESYSRYVGSHFAHDTVMLTGSVCGSDEYDVSLIMVPTDDTGNPGAEYEVTIKVV